jgi:hypothetical protein
MTTAAAALDCWGALDERQLAEVVSTALGRPVDLAGFETTAVPYQPGSRARPPTASHGRCS